MDQSFGGSDAIWSNLTLTVESIQVSPPTTVATSAPMGCMDSIPNTFAINAGDITWIELDWDASADTLFLDTEGSNFDTEIGIYDANGTLIANNDDGGSGRLSLLELDMLPAGTYYVAAAGFNTTFGTSIFDVTTNSTSVGTLNINASTGCCDPTSCNAACTTTVMMECDGDPCTTGDMQVQAADGSECSCTPGAVDMASCDAACTTVVMMECDGDPTTTGDVLVLAADGSTCSCVSGGSTPIPTITCPPAQLNFCDGTYDCMFADANPATDGNGVTDSPIIGGTAAFATDAAGVIDLTQLSPGGTYTISLNYEENGTLGTEVSCTFTVTVPDDADGGRF